MSVNIENIMKEIRQEIKDKGYSYDMLSFNDTALVKNDGESGLCVPELDNNLHYLNASCSIPSYRPLVGNKIVVFVKKVIRKLTKFYVEPIVASQNEFNAFNVRVLNELVSFVKKQNEAENVIKKTDELLEKIDLLELQLKTCSSEISSLNDRIEKLEKENRNLKEKAD